MTLLTWPVRILVFLGWFTWQVVAAGVVVIRDVLTPADLSTPRIARVVTRCENDVEVSLLSMAVTLIPGTLVVATEHPRAVPERDEGAKGGEARPDNPVLYIHALDGTRADLLAETAELERRLLGALRPQGVTR